MSEFENYLRCGLLEHGFLRGRCDTCHHENLVASAVNIAGLALFYLLVPVDSVRRDL